MTACTTPKPNVILILADDLGWKDVGFMGSQYYETPNLDQLASSGIVFTRAYAGAANCAPSRACLMSGQNTPRHGIYTVNQSDRGNKKTRRLVPTPNTTVLADQFITLGEELEAAGYRTASMGKWHLNEDPRTQGFTVNVAGGKWGHPAGYFAPFAYPDIEAKDGEHLTDLLTQHAIGFIQENRDNPFFLYLPYYAVHTPIQGKPHLIDYYTAKGGDELQHNPVYAAMVATMDSCIGEIVNELDVLNLREKTLILFSSDNGGLYQISRQDPLRGGKGAYYEGGIRVPLVVNWPAEFEPKIHTSNAISNLDFYPTLLDLLGLEPLNNQLDGRSFESVLSGSGDLEQRPIFFHFPIYLEANKSCAPSGRDPLFRTRPGAVVIDGEWKLHWYFEDRAYELYNLKEDIGETKNVANVFPDQLQALQEKLKQWIEDTEAPIPHMKNLDYDAEFEAEKISKWQ